MKFSRKEYWSGYHPFSGGSSQTRDRTQVSHIACRFFTTRAIRKAMYDVCVCVLLTQWCPILCDPMHCSPPGSFVHEFSRQECRSGLPFLSPVYDLAATAAKSLQSCPTLCDPIDGSPPGSPIPGILQAKHWSGLPFPSPIHESEKWKWSRSVVSDPQWPC